MKRFLIGCTLALALPALAGAADNADTLLRKALDELSRTGYVGDTSTPERYLKAVLELEPDNLEAQWQLLYMNSLGLIDMPFSKRAGALAALSPEFGRLSALAKKNKQEGLMHLINALHAGYYNAFDRALPEIDRAVAADPESVRFMTWKGRLMGRAGKWSKDNGIAEKGIEALEKARLLSQAHPSVFVREASFDFYLAEAYSNLSPPRWNEVTAHYERFLEKAPTSTLSALTWNNLSLAYRRLGACDKARDAADKALAVMDFGMARKAKQLAEFCVEMAMGGAAQTQANAATATTSPAGK